VIAVLLDPQTFSVIEAHQLRGIEHEEIRLAKYETGRQEYEQRERETKHKSKKKLPILNGDDDRSGTIWICM
jgi:hypothetical protein